MHVHPSDATNLGQFLSDHFRIADGTFYQHCECFYRKKILNRPSPFFWVFWGVSLRNFGAQVSAHLRLSGLVFYVSGIFRIIPRGYFFVVPNEFLPTWSCYISSESIFDADFEFWICLVWFNFGTGRGKVGVTWGLSKMNLFKHDRQKTFLMWIFNFEFVWPNFNFWALGVFILFLDPRRGSKYNIQKRVLFYSLFSSIIISSLSAHHRGSNCVCVCVCEGGRGGGGGRIVPPCGETMEQC